MENHIKRHPLSLFLKRLWVILSIMCGSLIWVTPLQAEKLIRGVVRDAQTEAPLPVATIQVEGTYDGTIANTDGAYELVLHSVPATLQISYIGYQSQKRVVTQTTAELQDISLTPLPIELQEIVVTPEDVGSQIMRKVIDQKQTWWQNMKTFKVTAYSRFVYHNDTNIVAIVENLAEAFWDREKGWREILKDKRETKNLDSDFIFPTAAAVNLYDDEIHMNGHDLIGVTHPDALDHYDFRVIGRRLLDDHHVYDISVNPKNNLKSAFEGRVSVLDSVYAIVAAELQPNRAFLFPPPMRVVTIKHKQKFRNFGDNFWLPVGLQSEIGLEIEMIGLAFPPVHGRRITKLSDYQINVALPDSLYQKGKRVTTIDSVALAKSNLLATAGVAVPLSKNELIAFENIDSTMTLNKVFKPKGFFARFVDSDNKNKDREMRRLPFKFKPEVWYNRVDGGHIGGKISRVFQKGRVSFDGTGAYNTGLQRWSFEGEATLRWAKKNRGHVIVTGFRGTDVRYTSALYDRFMVSAQRLFGAQDYFDYFWNEGMRVRTGYRFQKPRLKLAGGVNVERHQSVAKTTDWSLVKREKLQRLNPQIQAGNFRSVIVQAELSGKNTGPAPMFGQRKIRVEVEHSRPGFLQSDFSFTQFRLALDWRFETFFRRRFLPNVLDVHIVGSTFTGQLPRQRYSILDTWLDKLTTFGGFRSHVDRPYEGEKHLGLFWEHHFRTVPFEFIGWKWGVKKGLGIILHGAHGRTWFSDQTWANLNYMPQYQNAFHHEIGASLNGLFDMFRVNFTKRLDKPGFYVSVGIARIF